MEPFGLHGPDPYQDLPPAHNLTGGWSPHKRQGLLTHLLKRGRASKGCGNLPACHQEPEDSTSSLQVALHC